jgi:hypothetical protein
VVIGVTTVVTGVTVTLNKLVLCTPNTKPKNPYAHRNGS